MRTVVQFLGGASLTFILACAGQDPTPVDVRLVISTPDETCADDLLTQGLVVDNDVDDAPGLLLYADFGSGRHRYTLEIQSRLDRAEPLAHLRQLRDGHLSFQNDAATPVRGLVAELDPALFHGRFSLTAVDRSQGPWYIEGEVGYEGTLAWKTYARCAWDEPPGPTPGPSPRPTPGGQTSGTVVVATPPTYVVADPGCGSAGTPTRDTGCSGDSADTGSSGCSGDAADTGSSGCSGDSAGSSGCDSGGGSSSGCSGDSVGSQSCTATRAPTHAVAGTIRLLWPIVLVLVVNRRLRRTQPAREKKVSVA